MNWFDHFQNLSVDALLSDMKKMNVGHFSVIFRDKEQNPICSLVFASAESTPWIQRAVESAFDDEEQEGEE